MAPPPPRVLIVGYGSIGRRHGRNLAALGVTELLVYDVDPQRRAAAAEELGAQPCAELEQGLAGHPDAVFVCTPPAAHLSPALAAAAAGCHLLIEKPLADRLEGTEALATRVRAQGLITLVGCNLRFHPGLRAVRRLIADGVVGRAVSARAEVGQYLPDWHPWEDYRRLYSARADLGGGIILDAVHEVDYLRWLMGEITAVACFAGRLSRLEIDTEDTAAMLLRFRGGAIGEVHMDYVQRAHHRSCRIVGDEGTIEWDYGAGETRWYSARTARWEAVPLPSGWEPNGMYLDEVRHFLACLRGEETPELDVDGARQVLAVALAAHDAARSGTTVRLETDGAQGGGHGR